MKIRKGDKVKVIAGKYKGVESEVEKVIPKKSKVVVSGVNTVVRHIEQRQGQGGRVKVDSPIDVSNLMLICPECEEATRVGYKKDGNNKLRYCKKCTKTI